MDSVSPRPREGAGTPSASRDTSDGVISIRVSVLARWLVVTVLSLSAASYVMHLATRAADVGTIAALDVGDEVSLATWFQTLLFLAVAATLGIGRHRARARHEATRGWDFLAVVMVGLSIDEAVSVHERVGSALRDVLDTGGYLYYVWVVPALILAALVALVELGWLRALPVSTRRLVLLSGVIFVLGAAGLEIIAGVGDEANGTQTLTSVTLSAIEELAEMTGLSLMVVALLRHLAGHSITVAVRPA